MTQPAEETESDEILLNKIEIRTVLDKDGDRAVSVIFTRGLVISDALGMLDYAGKTLWDTYQRGLSGED